MKKLMLCILIAGCTTSHLQAQAKQTKVLLQQIAALKVYIDYAQQGYSVARKGLKAIGDFKNGEFGLHSSYFTSLKMVNPEVKNCVKVAELIALQVKIMQDYSRTDSKISQSGAFTNEEFDYIERVYDRLIEDCEAILDQVIAVTTDGELEMTDDERLQRIDALYADMVESYKFCKGFGNEALVLAGSRERENREVQNSRALRGINQD